ncbi:MAG: DUF4339 domain-containing protein [Opitutales bacterium]|nr:DUF4339 domain-containing protein [Opitutales bacterium]
MWYYTDKSGAKFGPVADAALKRLYESGKIDGSSLVSRGLGSAWAPLGETPEFAKIKGRRIYKRLTAYTRKTRVFRALLLAFALANLAYIFAGWKRLGIIESILNSGGEPGEFMRLYAAEYVKVIKFYSLLVFAMMLFLFRAMFNWMNFSLYNAKLLDKNFRLNPLFYSLSFFIPVANFFLPYYAVWSVFRVSKQCVNRRMNIFDANYILLFWFFNVFAIVVNAVYFVLYYGKVEVDAVESFIWFNGFRAATVAAVCFLWFIIATKIYNIQKRALGRFE